MKGFLSTILVVLLISATSILSQVSISGDARVRPRLDIDDRSDAGGNLSSDFYYMYRMRLGIKADIGDGYFAFTRLAHNGVAMYGKFATGLDADLLGSYGRNWRESGQRMSVDFMELNFGRKHKEFGFKLGLFGVGSFANPIYDVHYFPNNMIDVPFFILNIDGAYGGTANVQLGDGQLNISAFVDDALGIKIENANGDEIKNTTDQYTFGLDYSINAGEFGIKPMLLYTMADDSMAAPLTLGANISTPKLGPLSVNATLIYSMQSRTDQELSSSLASYGMKANEYSAFLGRLKLTGPLGPGSLTFWIDYGSRTDKFTSGNEATTNFMYTWTGYTFSIYKGDHGEFSITPEWRLINISNDDVTLRNRNKIEINFDVKFN